MAAPTEGTLAHMREKLIELTGREDLRLVDAIGKKKADFFINAGQRLLDRLIKHPNTEAWYIPTSLTTAGDFIFKMKYVRSFKEVWVIEDTTEGEAIRTRVTPTTFTWIKANYGYPVSASDYGIPAYWAPVAIGLAPEQYALTSASHTDIPDTHHITYVTSTANNPFIYDAVILAPVCQAGISIHILADFLSRPLSAETDMNFWTLNYPEALILAAAERCEAFMRNSQGAADYMKELTLTTDGIDMDIAERDVAQDSDLQMDSSWDDQ